MLFGFWSDRSPNYELILCNSLLVHSKRQQREVDSVEMVAQVEHAGKPGASPVVILPRTVRALSL